MKNNSTLLIDTSIGSNNLGDFIIMDAINENINFLKNSSLFRISSHQPTGKTGKRLLKSCDKKFLCGSNLLGFYYLKRNQMNIGVFDLIFKKKLILLGVGWRQEDIKINLLNRFKIKNLLSKEDLHSVRDNFTKIKLNKLGFNNVINTSCPTTWGLTKEHTDKINYKKSKKVLFTFTDYNKDKKKDRELLNILKKNYDEIFFWAQGLNDLNYFNSFDKRITENVNVIGSNLKDFNDFLYTHDVDYIGTRLHAGIRALQLKKRTIIVSIDNRTKYLGEDINLRFIKRANIEELEILIHDESKIEIRIPTKEIEEWKKYYLQEYK